MALKMWRTWTYELFLSFRGLDVRKGFVYHLYIAPIFKKEICVFLDACQLRKLDYMNMAIKFKPPH